MYLYTMNTQHTCDYSNLTTTSAFNLEKQSNSLVLTTPSRYNEGDTVTVSYIQFMSRLFNELKLSDNIGLLDNFDWNNVLLAGGYVSGLMEKNYDSENYKSSDLDFFIFDKNRNIVIKKLKKLYRYFSSKLDVIITFRYKYSPVVNIFSPKFNRTIQIIGCIESNPLNILKQFDLTHCQVGFDGHNIISTSEFKKAMISRITTITKRTIHAYRLLKSYNRGYSINSSQNSIYIKNYFCDYSDNNELKKDPHDYSRTDMYRSINNVDIEELKSNPIVKQNMEKSYQITTGDNGKLVDYHDDIIRIYGDVFDNYICHIENINIDTTISMLETSNFFNNFGNKLYNNKKNNKNRGQNIFI